MNNLTKNNLFFCFLFLSYSVFAQTDTTTIRFSEETNYLEEQRFIDTYDFVFMTREETKNLFKIDFLGLLPNLISSTSNSTFYVSLRENIGLSYERKLNKALSINTHLDLFWSRSFRINSHLQSANLLYNYASYGLRFELEPRWYFQMNQRIKSGKSANNLTGNYLALNGSIRVSPYSINTYDLFNEGALVNYKGSGRDYSFKFKYGLQRRIFRRSYIDLGFFAGLTRFKAVSIISNTISQLPNDTSINFGIDVKMGLALTGQHRSSVEKCDAFKCFREEKKIFKIDLINLINGSSLGGFSGKFSIGYETKLSESSWSINNELFFSYNAYKTANLIQLNQGWNFNYAVGLTVEPRYYYNLKKRILTGKSANNLSASYFAVRFHGSTYPVTDYSDYPYSTFLNTEISAALIWGIQQRIFEHGFIDYKIGLGPATKHHFDIGNSKKGYETFFNNNSPELVSELKIGLAF